MKINRIIKETISQEFQISYQSHRKIYIWRLKIDNESLRNQILIKFFLINLTRVFKCFKEIEVNIDQKTGGVTLQINW